MIIRAPQLVVVLLFTWAALFFESVHGESDGPNKAQTEHLNIEKGKVLAFDRNLGNCLACHFIAGGELPGNVGPPLIQMKLRFPDRAVLRAQIWDAKNRNPDTVMPPYGRHGILTEQELDLVVDYIHEL